MVWNDRFDKEHEPSAEQISDFVDTPLWSDLADYLQQTYQVKPKSSYSGCSMDGGFWKGWNVQYKKSGKALCSLYPKQGYYVALMAVSLKDIPEAELLLPLCSGYTQNLWGSSGIGHTGKSLAFEITSPTVLSDVKRFIALRAGVKDDVRKPQPSQAAEPLYRSADEADIDRVTDLLCELYEMERGELWEENKTHFADKRQGFFLALADGKPIGVAHVALRSDYVNGTEHGGTCGYLEAIYVKPEYRLNGIAASLVRLCEAWAKEHGCREFASDCLLHNTESHRFHLALGFTETERCIFFRKDI